jgi:5-methylcytosine-specific restriction endonuclease McrA
MTHKWDILSRSTFERDNYTCQDCGQKSKTKRVSFYCSICKQYGVSVEDTLCFRPENCNTCRNAVFREYITSSHVAHHIVRDGDYSNTPLENLKTLCNRCHSKYRKEDLAIAKEKRGSDKYVKCIKCSYYFEVTKDKCPKCRCGQYQGRTCDKCGNVFNSYKRTTCPICRTFFISTENATEPR